MKSSAAVFGLLMTMAVCGCTGKKPEAVTDFQKATVLYASSAPHDQQIFVADGEGNDARPLLSEPGYDYNASISRDGQWVVFTSERNGAPDLYRVRIDGSGLERLTDDRAFDDAGLMSPDGRSVAFVSTRGDGNPNIWLLDLASGTASNLTAGSPGDYRPAFSPDGKWIVFSSIRDSIPLALEDDPALDARELWISNLYVVRPDGTGLRQLTTDASMYSPSWSADGRRILALEIDGLAELMGDPAVANPGPRDAALRSVPTRVVAVDVDSGTRSELAREAGFRSAFSPQEVAGHGVVYTTPNGVRVSNGTTRAQGEFRRASWSGDGSVMVFHRAQPMPAPAPGRVPPQGSPTAFRLVPSLDDDFPLLRTGQWPSMRPLPASGELVMNNQMEGQGYNALLAVTPDGQSSRVIFSEKGRDAIAPAVSPDGELIAFHVDARGFVAMGSPGHLALIRPDGSDLRILMEAGDYASHPSWSPDGRRLVYVQGGAAEERGLRVLDLESGSVTIITSGPDNTPSWSPTGNLISFTRAPRSLAGASQIFTVRPDGTDLRQITSSPGVQDAHQAWSPDGEWIAFTSSRTFPRDELPAFTAPNLYAHHINGQIFVMRADGSDARQLTDNAYNNGTAAWYPGGID